MALGRKILDQINPNKKGTAMAGVKDWAVSPGGLITIVGFVIVILWVNHKTSK